MTTLLHLVVFSLQVVAALTGMVANCDISACDGAYGVFVTEYSLHGTDCTGL